MYHSFKFLISNLKNEGEYMFKTFSPYRLCPLGAHIDHQKGIVTGFAIDKGIIFDYQILEDNLIDVISDNFEGQITFRLNDYLELTNDWANQLRGVVKYLNERFNLIKGVKGKFTGQLPTGGLSSSSAIAIAFTKALAHANDFSLTGTEIINLVHQSETNFLNLKIGLLDPSCEVLCEKDKLLYLDTLTLEYRNISMKKKPIDFEFLIVFCGAERKLVNTIYNVRVDECKTAAYNIKAFDGIKYEKYENAYLRDISRNLFDKYKNKLPNELQKRAAHYYDETQRVTDGIEAWENGDIVEFGKLVFESGQSSIELYEVGSKPLIELSNILRKTPGIYGARFMGGGFNGSCLAIIDPNSKERILNDVKDNYLKKYPQYKDEFSMHLCKLTDGVKEI